jgi:hypothetical protein
VIDPAEKFLHFNIHDPTIPLFEVVAQVLEGLVCAPARSKPITTGREVRVEDQSQHLQFLVAEALEVYLKE